MHRKMNKQVGGEEQAQQINNLRRGLWTEEEDRVLSEYMRVHGGGRWNRIPKIAGLKRCGKSCRLRWLNYLSPTVKRGGFSEEEEDLIIRLHKLLGNRWSLIAGRVPGRTDNQVKNHWNTHLSKRLGIQNQFKSNKIRMNKQSSTVGACSSPHHHHDQNPSSSSSSSVLNSRFNLFDQQQDSRKDKDNNNSNYLEQDDDHIVNYAETNTSIKVDHEEEEDLLMTSRLSESSYSCCYDDDPHDDSLLLSTRHSHLDNFFEFFDSSTLDMNQVL